MIGGWAWLTSIMLGVIGSLSSNVGLQFGNMSDSVNRRLLVVDHIIPQSRRLLRL